MGAYNKYIEEHAKYAIDLQIKTGVPAAITLAQGIQESAGGTSEAAIRGNNHWGITANDNWKKAGNPFIQIGKVSYRKFSSLEEAYESRGKVFTQNDCYKPCFKIPVTDSDRWAQSLVDCHYAEDKDYASKLKKIIDYYDLNKYTEKALQMSQQGYTPQEKKNNAPTPEQSPLDYFKSLISQQGLGDMGEEDNEMSSSILDLFMIMFFLKTMKSSPNSQQNQNMAESVAKTGRMDITNLTNGLKSCTLVQSGGKARLDFINDKGSFSHELSKRELDSINMGLTAPGLTPQSRMSRVDAAVSAIVRLEVAQQSASQNFNSQLGSSNAQVQNNQQR